MSEPSKQVPASVESVEKLIHDLDHVSKESMVSISTVQSKISGSDKKEMKQKKEGLLRRLFSWFMILITSTKTVDASNDGVPPRNEQDGSSTQVTQCDAEETPECVPSMRITSPTCSMSESPKQVSASVESVEKLIHDLDHFSKELMVSILTVQSKISGSDKKVVALVQVFPEYFGFPCQSSFHQLLHNHPRLSSGAGTTGQKWPQYKELSPTPLAKKKVPLPSQTPYGYNSTNSLHHLLRGISE